jgi:membrane protein YdbS with pleckstrin-like domain
MKFENLQVFVNDIPQAEDLQYEKLHPEYKSVKLLRTVLFVLLFAIAGITVISLAGWLTSLAAWLLMAGILTVYSILNIVLIYRGYPRKGYAIRDHDLAYKTGYLFHTQTIMPFTRIQHCELSQGPMEKMFDLCSLNIYTAGGSGSDLVIPGLHFDEGEKLRAYILKRVEAHAAN